MRRKNLIRNAYLITVQGKKGFYVESDKKNSVKDIEILKDAGFHTYTIRHSDIGTPATLEEVVVQVNHSGYAVFTEEIIFPERKTDRFSKDYEKVIGKYYCLNNQYSSIDYSCRKVNLLNKEEYNYS